MAVNMRIIKWTKGGGLGPSALLSVAGWKPPEISLATDCARVRKKCAVNLYFC